MAELHSTESKIATAKAFVSVAASVAATAVLIRSIAQDLLPVDLQDHLFSSIRTFFSRFSSDITMVIDEFDGLNINQIYEAAEVYLGSKISPSARRFKVSQPVKEHNITVTMERDQMTSDVYNGAKVNWVLVCRQVEARNYHNPRDLQSTLRSQFRSFELTFHKKHNDMILKCYLPFILKEAKSLKQKTKTLKIFTVDYDHMYSISNLNEAWMGTNLDHPSTFETLALETDIKNFVLQDLQRFVKRKDYYRQVGKAWKRGYLLYGPPGTGKSSLIAAMANYLNFDVYDMELTELRCNSELRKLLIAMANKSILVVEDIDCTVEFHERMAARTDISSGDRENQVTLSGLLNFIDGLWSSCGDERIIVFTTNHKDKLDPALLRPGRMDVHVNMSYCSPCGFRQLAANYLGIKDHVLFQEIEDSMRTTKVTPAEVAEQLMKGSDHETALKYLIELMKVKREENQAEASKQVEQSSCKEVPSDVEQAQSEELRSEKNKNGVHGCSNGNLHSESFLI